MSSPDFFISQASPCDISCHRLLLPAVSVGNVPQLAVDVLINSLGAHRIGWINHRYFLPLVGNDAFGFTSNGSLNTAAEVYLVRNLKLIVLQLRSPLAKNKTSVFVDGLVKWIDESKFSDVVLLASSYAEERKDRDIISSPQRFILNTKSSDLFDKFTNDLHWTPHDNFETTPNGPSLFLPGSGFARHLYTKCDSRLVILTRYCGQGDNIMDAIDMLNYTNEWMDLTAAITDTNKDWTIPVSWKTLYGGMFPNSLY